MRRLKLYVSIFLILLLMQTMTSAAVTETILPVVKTVTQYASKAAAILQNYLSTKASMSAPQPTVAINENEEDGMIDINIIIGSSAFTAKLYDNSSTKALLKKFPMTVSMSELNGNEKYYYLPEKLPADSEKVGNIREGDLMLYGSDCLVLFYESFSTSYSYTRLGYIEDVSGLTDALGRGNTEVIFQSGS